MLDTTKPLGLNVNREQAALLLNGLKVLPDTDKNNVIYDTLMRDLETIVVIWDRRIKNEKIIQEQRRKLKQLQKQNQKSGGVPPAPVTKPPAQTR